MRGGRRGRQDSERREESVKWETKAQQGCGKERARGERERARKSENEEEKKKRAKCGESPHLVPTPQNLTYPLVPLLPTLHFASSFVDVV